MKMLLYFEGVFLAVRGCICALRVQRVLEQPQNPLIVLIASEPHRHHATAGAAAASGWQTVPHYTESRGTVYLLVGRLKQHARVHAHCRNKCCALVTISLEID